MVCDQQLDYEDDNNTITMVCDQQLDYEDDNNT